MPCKCARYDAAGNKILPHSDMRIFYQNDPKSLDIVKRFMPFRYICLPDIEIRIPVPYIDHAYFYKIYPGETKEFTVTLSCTALDYLRKQYRRSRRWETLQSKPGWVVFHRKGGVILDPLHRYGFFKTSA